MIHKMHDCDCSYCQLERACDYFSDEMLPTIGSMVKIDTKNAVIRSCPRCYGKGFRWKKVVAADGEANIRTECKKCFGTGGVFSEHGRAK